MSSSGRRGFLDRAGKVSKDFIEGFKHDYSIGGEDNRRAMHRTRELEGKTAEGPKIELMTGSYPLGYRTREILGTASPEGLQARKEADMSLLGDRGRAFQAGQLGGTIAADLTQDTSRRFYWLLNALQATGEVINESVLAAINKEYARRGLTKNLYGKTPVINESIKRISKDDTGNWVKTDTPLRPKDKASAEAQGVGRIVDDRLVLKRGYGIEGEGDDAVIVKRNFEPGFIQSLAIPSGIAINTGLGLMSPFGGAEGYKAALPSEEDPTKTSNVLGEIALKYVMGRTGNLLPYEEFVKVRPDVSPEEYRAYQAFKYDKNTDLDPSDGDLTLLAGGLKATDEGIHGPEIQFLGRSLPLTTGIVPFASAVAGGAYGVTRKRPIRGGFLGGMGGLVAGQVGGNILEEERRRRNAEDNRFDRIEE